MTERFDCFLAHNAADKPAVEELAHRLREETLEPWLDTWNLVPGSPWQEGIEKALATCETCVVMIGPSGLGPWQHEEMRVAIQRRVDEGGFRVIPVLLPGASRDRRGRLPGFLIATVWVEFRETLDDSEALRRLVSGVRGVAPGPGPDGVIARGACPYVGLRTFQTADARYFFGREAATGWLLDRLRPGRGGAEENRFLAVVGASGSGKSSLVRAGLIPALQRGALPGSADWPVVVMRPGEDAIESLAVALAADPVIGASIASLKALLGDLADDAQQLHLLVRVALHGRDDGMRVVIVVDQFEEVFTLGGDEVRRAAFLDGLLHASGLPGGQTLVIATMRADFFGKCAAHAGLTAALSDDTELVGPMSDDELRAAIERPTRLAGGELQSGLTELLVEHVRGRPGALPLLQHALLTLWQRRSGRQLTLKTYRAMGELDGAMERHAEAVFEAFSDNEREVCQRLLLRLIQPGAGTEDTRRRARRSELDDDDGAAEVLARLSDARLVTTEGAPGEAEDGHVEISHEALIRGWSRLRGWIEESREALVIQHRLAEASAEWHVRRAEDEGEGAGDFLFRGARLAEVEEWTQVHGDGLNDRERGFVAASVALRDREVREREAQRERELSLARDKADAEARAARRLRARAWLLAGIGAVALVAAGVATVFFFRASVANREVNAANQQMKAQLAREALGHARRAGAMMESEPLMALHSLIAAIELDPMGPHTGDRRLAARALAGNLELLAIMEHQAPVLGAAFSKDGSRILTWSWDSSARVWNTETGEPITPPMQHQDPVGGAAFSEDESRILTWSSDSSARVWNGQTGEPLTPPMKHQYSVEGAAFSTDESRILTWSWDSSARVWSAQTGEPLTPPMKHQGAINGAAFSKDGSRILTWSWDSSARVWSAETGEPMTPPMKHQNPVGGAAWSKDESRILTWSWDSSARVWNAQTGEPLTPSMKHQDSVVGAAWSRDESRILTWSLDSSARVWNAQTGEPMIPPMKHQGPVPGAAWSKDESRILTWSWDSSARVWSAQTGEPMTLPMKHQDTVRGAAFTRDESRILTWSSDSSARVWSAQTGEPMTLPMKHQGDIHGAAWSKDESRILTWSSDSSARMWNAVATGEPMTLPMKHQDTVRGAAFTRDESRILTWSWDSSARVWNAQTGEPMTPPMNHQGLVRGAAWSKDESRILTWSSDDSARVWNAQTGEPMTPPMQHQGTVRGAALSEDESRILTWSSDSSARVWNGETGEPMTPPMKHQGTVRGAALSKDESRILTWSSDDSARVWNGETGEPMTPPMKHQSNINGAAFSKDESRILTWSSDDSARVWNAQTGEPVTPSMKHQGTVRGAALSQDESRLLTWSLDSSARVWNAQTGEPITPPMRHQGSVVGAAFTRDESRILTWSKDGTARVWTLPIESAWPLENVALRHQVRTGTRMRAGAIEVITAHEWYGLQKEHDRIERDLTRASPAVH